MRSNKINVLYVHSSSQLWGSDRCLYHMLKLIDRRRYQPCVVLPCKGPLSERIEALGIDIIYPPCMSIVYRFRNPVHCFFYFVKLFIEIIWLTELFKRRRIALVHVNTSSVIGPLIAARLCRVPAICHLREIRVSPRLIGRALATIVNSLANHVISISKAVADFANTGWIKPLSLEIIHDGLDCDEFPISDGFDKLTTSFRLPIENRKSKIANVLGIPPDCKVVSVIGRITFWKGIHVFIDAAKIVLRRHPSTYFLIVGASDTKQAAKYQKRLKDDVRKLVVSEKKACPERGFPQSGVPSRRAEPSAPLPSAEGRKGGIIFTGFVNDITEVLHRTDIFVLPSVYPEPFGMIVIEAMLAGKPVIATSHGGPIELIEDGKEGFLVKPNEPKQLAEKITVLIKSPSLCKEMGRRAHLHVARDFQMRKTMDSIHRTYNRMVGHIRRDPAPREPTSENQDIR